MKSNSSTEAIISMIESWKLDSNKISDEKSLLDYTKEWIYKIDRGGLFKVNDEFYIFIRNVELCARKSLEPFPYKIL